MADYYPLIARAIAGLDPSAPGESRRALYERARSALIAQLRSVEPPLSESEITRERLSLEEAVRKVESEAAQRARDVGRPGGEAPRPAGDRPRAGDAFRATTRPPLRPAAPPPPRNERPPGQEEPRAPRNLRPDASPRSQPPNPAPDSPLPPTRERMGVPRRGQENGVPQGPQQPPAPPVRGFRDIAADADFAG